MRHPLIKDKTHDPFIIFGGLFSRSLVSKVLSDLSKSKNSTETKKSFRCVGKLFESITTRCKNENELRKKIRKSLLHDNTALLPLDSKSDIQYHDMVFEVKNEPSMLDLDAIKGSIKAERSNRMETAEEELFRYLSPKVSNFNWGILTNGRIFRLYHKNQDTAFIEFDLHDIYRSKSFLHAHMFLKLLNEPSFRDVLLAKTKVIREQQSLSDLSGRVESFLASIPKKFSRFQGILICLNIMMIRYLEDCGILPVLADEYDDYSLSDAANIEVTKLKEIVEVFFSGKWFRNVKQEILSKEHFDILIKSLKEPSVVSALRGLLFWKCGKNLIPFDLSDIYIDHLGSIYETVILKHENCAHYTPQVISRALAEYLKGLNQNTLAKFSDNPDMVILDPACGSGQLLRSLVPFAHYFFEDTNVQAKNDYRRLLIARMCGIDNDDSSAFITKLGLALLGAEAGKGLAKPKLIEQADTLEEFSASRDSFCGISRKNIFAIVANPPWDSLEFNETDVYRKYTGEMVPKKSTKGKDSAAKIQRMNDWLVKNQAIVAREQTAIEEIKKKCAAVAQEHAEWFSGKTNLALHFLFVIRKLIEGKSSGAYIVVMPDRFLVGESCPMRDRMMSELDGYIPFQGCGSLFEGVDAGTRFGVIFGRPSAKSAKIEAKIPVIRDNTPVDFITKKISKTDLIVGSKQTIQSTTHQYALPFLKSESDIALLNSWVSMRTEMDSWSQGRINLGAKSKPKAYGRIAHDGSLNYKVVKSTGRKQTTTQNLIGKMNLEFGASISNATAELILHCQAKKLIVPNVKRNGVRKILACVSKDCIVEHAYNFTHELEEVDLLWVQSLTYNYLIDCLVGSYNINASLQNFIGKIHFSGKQSDKVEDFIKNEVALLEHLGFDRATSVRMLCTVILANFPESFISEAYSVLEGAFGLEFLQISDSELLITFNRKLVSKGSKGAVRQVSPDTRAAVAAFVVRRMHDAPTFGRIKLQKMLYLLEASGAIELGGEYVREAAGPLDIGTMYNPKTGVESVGRKRHYFSSTEKSTNGKRHVVYQPLESIDEAVAEVNAILLQAGTQDLAENLLSLLSPLNTERSEIVATIFAAWNDLWISGVIPSDLQIVEEVRGNWHKSKERFSEERIKKAIIWMRQNQLVPKGIGKQTRRKKN